MRCSARTRGSRSTTRTSSRSAIPRATPRHTAPRRSLATLDLDTEPSHSTAPLTRSRAPNRTIQARDAGEARSKRIGFANGLVFSTGNFMTGCTLLFVSFYSAMRIREDGLHPMYGGDADGTYKPSSDAFVAMFMI
mmetsp:Transcript_45416/g.125273  ORF Transcript_45416/g.125273 Transcript_45416/m.125273 type:complete len:136 (+) Transcript_45416:1062-1469(+)